MKTKKDKIIRDCVVCGRKIKVIIYPNKRYRGGHYFGKINIEKNRRVEYWECPTCYYGYQDKKMMDKNERRILGL